MSKPSINNPRRDARGRFATKRRAVRVSQHVTAGSTTKGKRPGWMNHPIIRELKRPPRRNTAPKPVKPNLIMILGAAEALKRRIVEAMHDVQMITVATTGDNTCWDPEPIPDQPQKGTLESVYEEIDLANGALGVLRENVSRLSDALMPDAPVEQTRT